MERLIRIVYFAFLFSFILPSGSLAMIPLKSGLGFLLLFLLLLMERKASRFTGQAIFVFIMLGLWSLLSLINGYGTSSVSFIRSYFSLLLAAWCTFEVLENNFVRPKEAFKAFGAVSALIIALKFLFAGGLTLGIFKVEQIVELFKTLFKTDLTTMYFPLGNITFYRLMVSNDGIPLAWFAFYMLSKKHPAKKIIWTLVIAIFSFVVYSRVILAQFALTIVAFIFVKLLGERRLSLSVLLKSAAVVAVVGVAAVAIISAVRPSILEGIQTRFFSNSSTASDQIRSDQIAKLTEGFLESPIIGHGTGTYIQDFTRSETTPFSYEAEYLSFLYQFGILGFVLIIGTTVLGFYQACFKGIRSRSVRRMMVFTFLVWLAKPLFNPAFLSSNSGLIIAIAYASGKHLDKSLIKEAALLALGMGRQDKNVMPLGQTSR